MKILLANCLFSASILLAQPQVITNLWLDDQVAVEIPVGLHRVTTLNFPHPLQGLDAAGIGADARSQFQLAHSGSSVAVRALGAGASGNLNVRLKDQTYVLLLNESRNPVLAVNFLAASSAPAASVQTASPVSPRQLLGLLDRARHYDRLRRHHPSLVSDVTRAQPRSIMDYPTFSIRLDQVFRFDRADALVFEVSLQGKTGREVRYHAGSWSVRVGDHAYPQALADAAGVIPAEGAVSARFVIQGSPDGGRNLLSPRNAFLVLVNPL